MTDDAFEVALAARINTELNVPFLNEDQEQVAILWALKILVPLIPQSLRQFVMDAADGIDQDEQERLAGVLVAVLNQHIDIPFMTEPMEKLLLRPIVMAVLDLALKGRSISS